VQAAGRVVAVHRDHRHRFSKPTVAAITLVEGVGVEGDAHAGATVQHLSRVRRDPTQPNLRQVHLIDAELLDELAGKGYDVGPGHLGENVTSSGVDLLALPAGSVLELGDDAVITVTGLRNPCRQIVDRDGRSMLQEVLHTAADGTVVRRAGVMAVVTRAGVVRAGDSIRVRVPSADERPLEPV
jgi:MOSC domain-containing protein YiiM